MRLPGGLSVGYPLEHPARGGHLFIELGEEQLGERHPRTPSGESREGSRPTAGPARTCCSTRPPQARRGTPRPCREQHVLAGPARSEEHTSELQSHSDLVCRLLLEKKKKKERKNKKA